MALAVNSTKWAKLVVKIKFEELQPRLYLLVKIGKIIGVLIITSTMVYHCVIHCLDIYRTVSYKNYLTVAKYLDDGI
jgi:hypothetical protein